MRFAGIHAAVKIIVPQGIVMRLIENCRVIDVVIVLHCPGVHTPLGVHIEHRLAVTGSLGGNHHDTIGTSGTVESIGSRVLEDCHGLDIARVEVVEVSGIRHSVHNPQRAVPRIEGAEAPDTDFRIRTRLSGSVGQLHTGHLSGQRLRYVGLLALRDVLGLDRSCRAGEGLFLGGTERDDNHIVESLGIHLQDHINDSASAYRNLLPGKSDE